MSGQCCCFTETLLDTLVFLCACNGHGLVALCFQVFHATLVKDRIRSDNPLLGPQVNMKSLEDPEWISSFKCLQQWPNVLVEIWYKFCAASVFLDFFPRFCGILWINYICFISFTDVYIQINLIYAMSQYLQCCAPIGSAMLDMSLWTKSWLMFIHSFLIRAGSWSQLVDCCLKLCQCQNIWS